MAVRKVVTLLSGGIDSMVLADSLRRQQDVRQVFLFVDYGQRAAQQEFRAARYYAKGKGGIRKVVIGMKGIRLTSQLTTGRATDPAFLPGRNLLLLMAGAWKAVEERSDFIGIGLRDIAEFPDTSDGFVRAFSGIAYLAFGRAFNLIVPLLQMNKAEVVALGREYGTPLTFSYSCYLGRKRACGRCLGCRDRGGLDL